jgi:hypothetical protein
MGILDGYITVAELAAEFGVKRSTIDRWRRLRIGPPWAYKGKTPISHIDAWRDWLRSGGFKPRGSRKLQRTKAPRTGEDRPTT